MPAAHEQLPAAGTESRLRVTVTYQSGPAAALYIEGYSDPGGTMSEAHEGNVLTTYRSLRLAMIPLLLILVVSTALETTRGEVCVLGSVSAYFHTPVRGAFVAGLAGLGACLIAYKGNDRLENVLLDFAGFMAFLVALVPTTVDTKCGTKYADVVADANTADAVRNNVLTLLLVSLVGIGLHRLMPRLVAWRMEKLGLAESGTLPEPEVEDPKVVRLARICGWLALLVVAGEVTAFIAFPHFFKDVAHGVSAVTMVVGILGVMVANARGWDSAAQDSGQGVRRAMTSPARHWRNPYTKVALGTLGAIVVAALVRGPYLILVIELIVIGGFLAFWLMQTRELWNFRNREQKAQETDIVHEQSKNAERRVDQVPDIPEPPATVDPAGQQPVAATAPRAEIYKAL